MQTAVEARAEHSSDAAGDAIALIAEQLEDRFRREETALHRGARLTRFVPKDSATERPVLLEVRNLLVRRGSRLVIGNEPPQGQIETLSFKLHQGDLAILQAPNGWGKTNAAGCNHWRGSNRSW